MTNLKQKIPSTLLAIFSGALVFFCITIYIAIEQTTAHSAKMDDIQNSLSTLKDFEEKIGFIEEMSISIRSREVINRDDILAIVAELQKILSEDKSFDKKTKKILAQIKFKIAALFEEGSNDRFSDTFTGLQESLRISFVNLKNHAFRNLQSNRSFRAEERINQITRKINSYQNETPHSLADLKSQVVSAIKDLKSTENNQPKLPEVIEKTSLLFLSSLYNWVESSSNDDDSGSAALYWSQKQLQLLNLNLLIKAEIPKQENQFKEISERVSKDLSIAKRNVLLYGTVLLIIFLANFFAQYRLIVEARIKEKEVSTLVQILSHDIANPATIAISGLKFLKTTTKVGDQFTDTKVKMINKSIEAIERITQMVTTVRSMKSLESGKMNLKFQKSSLNSTIEKSALLFKSIADKKGITIKTNLHEFTEDLWVEADTSVLENQILSNLISNAIKFSPEGGTLFINLGIENDGRYVIKVKDQGIGIPSALLKNIFSESKATSRKGIKGETGTGFGMPLVKKFVEAHKGASISIESSEGESSESTGTTVSVSFTKAS